MNFGNTMRVADKRFASGEGAESGSPCYYNMLFNVARIVEEYGKHVDVIGTGGINSPMRAQLTLDMGAKAISYLTAFPSNPFLAVQIKRFLSEFDSTTPTAWPGLSVR
jgi:dihydroorotate dehydrogenase